MKKILFIVPSLQNGGGTIRSLQNLQLLISKNKYKIDVLPTTYTTNNIVELINCKVLPYNNILLSITSNIRHLKSYQSRLFIFIIKFILNLFKPFRLYKYISKLLTSRVARWIEKQNYDTIIAYQEGYTTKLVSLINHKNKIAWIHCDYSVFLKMQGGKSELNIYNQFKKIVCVSKFTKDSFLKIYPSLYNKTDYIYNILDSTFIHENSLKPIIDSHFENDDFTIVSIGRIDPVKQFSKLPEVASFIKNQGLKFKWYILGDGDAVEYSLIRENISKYNVSDCFILLGNKTNPYPYIFNSNLLVSSSLSEACPYAVNEAKVLHVPVIANTFGSASEFIEDQINGMIIPLVEMPEIICKFIEDKSFYDSIKGNAAKFVFDNSKIIGQIESLL